MDISEIIKKFAIRNRLKYGMANEKAIIGMVLARVPDARKNISEVMQAVKETVDEVNNQSAEDIQRELLNHGGSLEQKKKEKKDAGSRGLKLENPGKVVMRFAPNPSGPLHIGHARAAILNNELVKKYNGKLILRIEDTDPKRVDVAAYKMIENDLKLLGINWHEKVLQSERMEIYLEYCKKLIERRYAYVCCCDEGEFKKLKIKGISCPHRNKTPEENLKLYDDMKTWDEGRGSVKLKTDIKHKNPAIRDFPIMRVVDKKHPKISEHKIYPLMNFSVATDDHLLGITHVLRGKDHIINTERQRYIYKYFNWEEPIFIHYGLMKVEEVLSTTDMRKGIEAGKFAGWDDVGLWTIKSLIRRGIRSDAIKNYILSLGLKQKDIEFSPENLYAENKRIVEPTADRYYFVDNPCKLVVENVPRLKLKIPLHKDYRERGEREFNFKFNDCVDTLNFYIQKEDIENLAPGDNMRLMNFIGVKIKGITDEKIISEYIKNSAGPMVILSNEEKDTSEEREHIVGAKKIQWVYDDRAIKTKILRVDKTLEGVCESRCSELKVDDVIQFERIGFCRLDAKNDKLVFCFGHR
ncbi:MAG: glutamate--tRNA ligase [Candidatus Altiarchaeales archaeon HGW-Altiarchaeales-3]|nr:MAG: glutamate--tRNA ligase [Candidatus Altiarchaeales archaeon HGW-Altiarchaeales-3]